MLRTIALLVPVALCGSGCSVFMAATFPTDKDLSVVDVGTPRTAVEREFGAAKSQVRLDGHDVHVYEFEDGVPVWGNAIRAVGWAAADFFTIFLWEAVGTPIEATWRASTATTAEVAYDGNGRVVKATVRDWGGDIALETGGTPAPGENAPRVTKSSKARAGRHAKTGKLAQRE